MYVATYSRIPKAEYRIKKVFLTLMPGKSEDHDVCFQRRTSGCVIHGDEVERNWSKRAHMARREVRESGRLFRFLKL